MMSAYEGHNDALHKLCELVTSYVQWLDMCLMEESGSLDQYKPGMSPREYSPIVRNMTAAEFDKYRDLVQEVLIASEMSELHDTVQLGLTSSFTRHAYAAGLKTQELCVSVVVRAGLFTEDEMIFQWPTHCAGPDDADRLDQHGAPLLACIAREAALRPKL